MEPFGKWAGAVDLPHHELRFDLVGGLVGLEQATFPAREKASLLCLHRLDGSAELLHEMPVVDQLSGDREAFDRLVEDVLHLGSPIGQGDDLEVWPDAVEAAQVVAQNVDAAALALCRNPCVPNRLQGASLRIVQRPDSAVGHSNVVHWAC